MPQIIISLFQLALITVAFGLCFYLFYSLKREIHTSVRHRQADAFVARTRVEALERELAGLRKELETMQFPALPAPGATNASGINLNKRTQALRMMKLGEGPEHISAALSLPRKEVELLIKVQRLLLDSSDYPPS